MDTNIILGYDPGTLREKVDLAAAGRRLDELGELRSLSALNERVSLLRLVGRLDEAWDAANEALRQSRFAGDREQLALARIRRAVVQQHMGKLEPAIVELSGVVNEAHAHDWHSVEAYALQQRGTVRFDQKEFPLALVDFRAALDLRLHIESSPDQVESSMIAIAVTESFLDGGAA